jgi:hypothetical protein
VVCRTVSQFRERSKRGRQEFLGKGISEENKNRKQHCCEEFIKGKQKYRK